MRRKQSLKGNLRVRRIKDNKTCFRREEKKINTSEARGASTGNVLTFLTQAPR